MSLDDFCKLEFDEFESICIQPHIKKKITPRQLIPLPWDNISHKPDTPRLTPEEKRERFESVASKFGN